jgi:putative phosphoserine phosphatase / 1-acylglycerol-3-phosphate O-acyltransferase
MVSNDNYIAFFDVDQTIIHVNSGRFLVKCAYAKGLMSTKNLVHAVYLSLLYKFNLRDTDRIIDGMARWVKGLSEDALTALSEEVFHTFLLDAVRPEIITEIKYHRERNARVVILSSALQYICSPLAKHLAIEDVICSRLEVKDGLLTGRPEGRFCFGDEKAIRLRAYCEKMNCSPATAYYYADAFSDFKVLDLVGHPVCINPEKKLAGIARARHWIVHVWQ